MIEITHRQAGALARAPMTLLCCQCSHPLTRYKYIIKILSLILLLL